MAGKMIRKALGNNFRGNRKLRRSLKFGVGRYEGIIKSIKFVVTKSNKEAIQIIIYNPDTEMCSTFLITLKCYTGELLIDTLLDIFDLDDALPEDLHGLVVGFETELNGSYINLKSFYKVDTEFEEEIDDELEEELDEEIDDELEEELDDEYYDEEEED